MVEGERAGGRFGAVRTYVLIRSSLLNSHPNARARASSDRAKHVSFQEKKKLPSIHSFRARAGWVFFIFFICLYVYMYWSGWMDNSLSSSFGASRSRTGRWGLERPSPRPALHQERRIRRGPDRPPPTKRAGPRRGSRLPHVRARPVPGGEVGMRCTRIVYTKSPARYS